MMCEKNGYKATGKVNCGNHIVDEVTLLETEFCEHRIFYSSHPKGYWWCDQWDIDCGGENRTLPSQSAQNTGVYVETTLDLKVHINNTIQSLLLPV